MTPGVDEFLVLACDGVWELMNTSEGKNRSVCDMGPGAEVVLRGEGVGVLYSSSAAYASCLVSLCVANVSKCVA